MPPNTISILYQLNNSLTRTALPPGFFAIPVGLFCFLTVFGVDALLSAGISLCGCLLVFFSRSGLEISQDLHFFRQYYSLFIWRVGSWQQLPNIAGITLKYFSQVAPFTPTRDSWGIWNNAPTRFEELVVMFSVQNASTGIIITRFSADEEQEATQFANDVANIFDVPVRIYLPNN